MTSITAHPIRLTAILEIISVSAFTIADILYLMSNNFLSMKHITAPWGFREVFFIPSSLERTFSMVVFDYKGKKRRKHWPLWFLSNLLLEMGSFQGLNVLKCFFVCICNVKGLTCDHLVMVNTTFTRLFLWLCYGTSTSITINLETKILFNTSHDGNL